MNMKLSELTAIAKDERAALDRLPLGLKRDFLNQLNLYPSHALIVAGIRRCGKSTILRQFLTKLKDDGQIDDFFYFNFDDFRLLGFSVQDFSLLDQIVSESKVQVLFFDEIQLVDGWECYIRMKLDQGFRIAITGSNAALLSREMGTRLTGRHITKELFPFSYKEYLTFSESAEGPESLETYLKNGGFPEYLKSGDVDVLTNLVTDILYRDIAVRYGIRDVVGLEKLFGFMVSNVGNLVSPSKLGPIIGVKSPSTILEYFSHLESSYLMAFVPKFSYSLKAQSLAPKKMYVLDQGLISSTGKSFTNDHGRILENFIFNQVRRFTDDVFYAGDGNWECDFVIDSHDSQRIQLVQVCWELHKENEERELEGLLKTMDMFGKTQGTIVTFSQSDQIRIQDKEITVIPASVFSCQARN